MFTGIIEGLGTITRIGAGAVGKQLTLTTDFDLTGTQIGDSIAVNGACLTAVALDRNRFTVDVAPETLNLTTLGKARVGQRVNLERALQLGQRLDGHLVSGHIDGVGTIRSKKLLGNAVLMTIAVPARLADEMIVKGSVAVDGISLTINGCGKNDFELSIIPHTAKLTTLGFKAESDAVNIETDMIGKYVKRFINRFTERDLSPKTETGGVDLALLAKNGFL